MKYLLLFSTVILFFSCQKQNDSRLDQKQMIIKTLENETKYFCQRNLEKWQEQWSHQSFVSKMYAGAVDFELLTGWEKINQFTVQHIKKNPNPIPIPDTNFDYDIHLFSETALVFYYKNVDDKRVNETRFMVKEGGMWKIGKMQTLY